jgi:hypothetical protein
VFSVYSGTNPKLHNFLNLHHHTIFDESFHYKTSDQDLFDWMNKLMLPILLKKRVIKPFALFVHIFGHDEVECRPRFAPEYPRFFRSLDCLDQNIAAFLRNVEKYEKWMGKVEVVVHSIGLEERDVFVNHLFQVRKMAFIVRNRKAGEIVREATLYDVPPTILDIANVEYSPRFPYGTSLLSRTRMKPPKVKNFAEIYEAFRGEFILGPNVSCNGESGFCRTSSFAGKGNALFGVKAPEQESCMGWDCLEL